MMLGNSKAKSALQDAVRILATVPGQAPNSQRLILEAAQRRARDAASLVASAHDRSGSKLWADAKLISGECAFRLGEPDEGLAVMLASAATYLTIAGDRRQDADLANVTYTISRTYSRLGDSKRAALFAAETYLRTPRRTRDTQRLVWCLAAMLAAGDRSAVMEALADLRGERLPELHASMFLILEHASGYRKHQLARILEADERLMELPAESAVLFSLTVAAEFRAAGLQDEALKVLERLLQQLTYEAAPPWTIARVQQVVADILVGEWRYREALDEALSSWVVLDEFRYHTGSPRFRRTIHDSYALARRAAMTAAAELQDWRLLSELIEAARLQSASDIEGSLEEFDAAIGGRGPAPRASRGDTRTINVDGLAAPYSYIYDDLTDSRTDLGMAADVTVAGRSMIALAREKARKHALHIVGNRKSLALENCLAKAYNGDALWWSTWHERGLIFWTVSRRTGPIDGGYIDLTADSSLRDALIVCCEGNRLPVPWQGSGSSPQDLEQALRVCGSAEELALTGTLAGLLPPQIRQKAETGQADAAASRLLISPAPELAGVPWPVLPVDGSPELPVRLIERYELQFVPSLVTIADVVPANDYQEAKRVPYAMSCDYLIPDTFPAPPRAAAVRFGTAQQRTDHPDISLATPQAVASFLRSLEPGLPGLITFRTHFNSVAGDPTASGFELSGGTLEAGWLLPRDLRADRTVLALTSRVLLSCCSTSAAQERYGGESLGLVAACLHSGARLIVATSVNILQTSFTNELDGLLIEMMLASHSHVRGLHVLQSQMLRDWRSSNKPQSHATGNDIKAPLPVVWAYYQAYGVDQREVSEWPRKQSI